MNRSRTLYGSLTAFVLVLFIGAFTHSSTVFALPQPLPGHTGAPGDATCFACHAGISTGGMAIVKFPTGLTYAPGVTQHLSVTVSDPIHNDWSFQLTARLASSPSTAQAGSFIVTDAINTIVVTSGPLQDIETTAAGNHQGTTVSSTWNFDWTPPATNAGNVNFYLVGFGAGLSGDALTGNGIYEAVYTLTPADAPPSLSATPSHLQFRYEAGDSLPWPQSVTITGSNSKTKYIVSSEDRWLKVIREEGVTKGRFRVAVNPERMSPGSYTGEIQLSASGTKAASIPVSLTIKSDRDDNRGRHDRDMFAEPYVYDPGRSGYLTSIWLNRMGYPDGDNRHMVDSGLVLSKESSSSANSQAGAFIRDAEDLSLTELGFDYRDGGQCNSVSPRFIVVTTDDVTHEVGGCSKGAVENTPVAGWRRVRFNLANTEQTNPVITPGQAVRSIRLVLDAGPETGAAAAGGLVVIDNIDVNGTLLGMK